MISIKNIREDKGVTQAELAKRLNVTQGAVSQWELGITKPRADVLLKLSSILECTVDELLGIEKTPVNEQN